MKKASLQLNDGSSKGHTFRKTIVKSSSSRPTIKPKDLPYIIDNREDASAVLYQPQFRASLEYLRRHSQEVPSGFANPEITLKMRRILIWWLLELAHEMRLRKETVFQAVYIIDQMLLTWAEVTISTLQLLGVTSLFSCCKYEEVYPPTIEKFIESTKNQYSAKDVIKMELNILEVMNYNITMPTRLTFLHFTEACLPVPSEAKIRITTLMLLEISLLGQWPGLTEDEIFQAAKYLGSKIHKKSYDNLVSDKLKEASYRILQLWKECYDSTLAARYDCKEHEYVGGLKVIY